MRIQVDPRWMVPGIPFMVSLALSATTVGQEVFWQDSGFYLVAVKEFDVLYPHGFGLYLLLCKAWTLLLSFVDFTLSVHLFSSLFSALAAGTLAVASRELLRARRPLFRATQEPFGKVADWAAVATGCIAAAGYTFWFTGLYAKGYSLYYFFLAQLLWWMIRAHETASGREFTWVAALMGLSWAAHPSAALLGPSFVAYALVHWKPVGLRGLAWRAALSGVCAVAPTFLVLGLARKGSLTAMGNPEGLGGFLSYVLGKAYTSRPGSFGWESSRAASFGQYLWEELLGIGLAAVAVGLIRLGRVNRRVMVGLLLWIVPFVTVTIAFTLEGQHDCWFVAAWMPLYLVCAVGLERIAVHARRMGAWVLAGLAAGSVTWAATVNFPLVNQRQYHLPEIYGHLHLDALDRDAVLVLSGDDPTAICNYLQRIRNVRPDLVLVAAGRLREVGAGGTRWYVERLTRAHPFLKSFELEERSGRLGNAAELREIVSLFLNANLDCGRALFTTIQPAPRSLRDDIALVPAGVTWKAVRQGEEKVDPKFWDFPITSSEVRRRYRRERGQAVEYSEVGARVRPEGYEQRLFRLLVNSRALLAHANLQQGNFDTAARIYEGILQEDPLRMEDPREIYPLGHAYYGLGDLVRSQAVFEAVLQRTSDPNMCTGSLLVLGRIFRQLGRMAEARRCWRTGLSVEGADPTLRREIETELQAP